jgi:NADPH:quinone reductase-like Zn-dependent oxidoreductase
MKAARIDGYGGKEVMRFYDDAPRPNADAGQVIVEVRAAGVNPFDWKVREGYMQQVVPLSFPATLGSDVAGVVVELGEGVTNFQMGDAVYGEANSLSGQGSFAEYTPVKATALAPKPEHLDFVQAAAVPLAAASAYQALVQHMQLKAGQRIFIHGGSGGIGSFAIQLAKHLGAYVATTATGNGLAHAADLGADKVIDYKKQDFGQTSKDFDAVFDTVGGETYTNSFPLLKPGGVVVSMVEQSNEDLAAQYSVTAIAQSTSATSKQLLAITELLENGTFTVQVDKTFPLEQTAEALEYLRTGGHLGKVLVTVK